MGTGMSPEKIVLIDVVGISGLPGNMIFRDIEHIKIVLNSHNRTRICSCLI